MKKLLILTFLSISVAILVCAFSSAVWVRGSLHQHTGYSTHWGYDSNQNTQSDNCLPIEMEAHSLGYSVAELKEEAMDRNLDWLAFSDHSYCTDSSEFAVVKSDCQAAQGTGFSCLWGEEVSAAEIVPDIEPFAPGCDITGVLDDGEAHIGAYGIDSHISQSPSARHCPSTPNVTAAINNINSQSGIAIINHPYSTLAPDSLEFLDFESRDVVTGEKGIEIWNEDWNVNDADALNLWRFKLQANERVYAFGGTDSHDNVSLDNFNMAGASGLTHSALENALSAGTNVVSNDGYVIIEAKSNTQSLWTQMGRDLDTGLGDILTVKVTYNVTHSCNLRVYRSLIGSYLESYQTYGAVGGGTFNFTYPMSQLGDYYFRAECISANNNYRTYTNPIWVSVSSAPTCLCSPWTAGSCGGGGCGPTQRAMTRSCNPSACGVETMCQEDLTCTTGGSNRRLTVCQSGGCNYTSITAAISNSVPGDRIFVNDSATYSGGVTLTASTAGWLECLNGARILGGSGNGVLLNNVDGPILKGCKIEGFTRGIYLNSSHGVIRNNTIINNNRGIYLFGGRGDNLITENIINDSSDYGIHFDAQTWGNSAQSNRIMTNILEGNINKGMWLRYGVSNTIRDNRISKTFGFEDTRAAIHLQSSGSNTFLVAQNNTIYNNNYGIHLQGASSTQLIGNVFCSSSIVRDIVVSGGGTQITGDDNRCDNAAGWNDAGTTGCTYSCDLAPSVTLLDPLDNSVDNDGNVSLSCYSEDDVQLANVTLYHNISGSWTANQTRVVTGISNTTIFNLTGLQDNLIFSWNCLAVDNRSRLTWGVSNWTVAIDIPPVIDVRDLQVVYANLTQRAFKFVIRNNISTVISNVAWNLSTGNGNKFSNYNMTLNGTEEALVFVYHNYTAPGSYTVRATAYNSQYSDTEVLNITI